MIIGKESTFSSRENASTSANFGIDIFIQDAENPRGRGNFRKAFMTLTIEATYENGVFVPTEKPMLADHERVRLIVEPVGPSVASSETVCTHRNRIDLDSHLAQEIAQSPDFLPDGN